MTALTQQSLTPSVSHSIEIWKDATTNANLKRARDIKRDKKRAVELFFTLIAKEPDEVVVADVARWHQSLIDQGLQEATIYTRLSHLSGYFEWLRKLPEFTHFIKFNPVRLVLPKPPKKYNSPKAKALTDEELSKLWNYMQTRADDDKNLIAVRDYAIFRLFMATGMRREEIIGLGAADIKITDEGILIHALVKGGDYEWRVVSDREVIDALERYLELSKRKSTIGDKNRALWTRFDRGAEILRLKRKQEDPTGFEPRLSSHSFDKQMKIYAIESGIGAFNIHKFRHTFARIVAEDTGSLIETQDALGHANIETTRVYVKRIQYKKDKHSANIKKRIVKSGQ